MGQELREQTSWSNGHYPILFSMPQEHPLERHLLNLEAPAPSLTLYHKFNRESKGAR